MLLMRWPALSCETSQTWPGDSIHNRLSAQLTLKLCLPSSYFTEIVVYLEDTKRCSEADNKIPGHSPETPQFRSTHATTGTWFFTAYICSKELMYNDIWFSTLESPTLLHVHSSSFIIGEWGGNPTLQLT